MYYACACVFILLQNAVTCRLKNFRAIHRNQREIAKKDTRRRLQMTDLSLPKLKMQILGTSEKKYQKANINVFMSVCHSKMPFMFRRREC